MLTHKLADVYTNSHVSTARKLACAAAKSPTYAADTEAYWRLLQTNTRVTQIKLTCPANKLTRVVRTKVLEEYELARALHKFV